jgi:hypothetical protein
MGHFNRMRLEIIDRVRLDPNKISNRFPQMRGGRYHAVHDISIANSLTGTTGNDATLDRLSDIVAG